MNDERQFGLTSEEYAGFYNLVTHGIEDCEYVGQMREDINASLPYCSISISIDITLLWRRREVLELRHIRRKSCRLINRVICGVSNRQMD